MNVHKEWPVLQVHTMEFHKDWKEQSHTAPEHLQE